MDNPKFEEAQAILEAAQIKVHALLAEAPEMQARVTNVLKTTINGLKFSLKSLGHLPPPPVGEGEPLTSFMGRPLSNKNKRPMADKEPPADDVQLLKQKAGELYMDLEALTNVEILEGEGDITVRAMAKIAGMTGITTNDPEKVDAAFIDEIRKAKAKKVALETEVKKVKATK